MTLLVQGRHWRVGYLVVRYVQSGTGGERRCWQGEQIHCNSSGGNDKRMLEGTGEVVENIQHWEMK